MKSSVWSILVMTVLISSADARAETAKEILETAWNAQVDRWEGLDSYLVEQSVMGQASRQYFVRAEIVDSRGETRTMFLPGTDANNESGCVNVMSADSGSSGGGDSSGEYMSWFMNNAELVGEESVDGQSAMRFHAEGLEQSQAMGDQEITMDSMSMWLSKGDYLPLKTRMNGVATIEGQDRPVVVDTVHSDFRTVPGSRLREPYRRVVNISGMLGSADSEQVSEARAQLAEFEKQMASMPASQREMMKNMMGPKLDMLRNLAETGGLETEIIINSITANPEKDGKRVVACDPSG